MLATYILQSCLVTVYVFALIMIRFNWTPAKMRNLSPVKRTLLAIQHSTGSFLSASFVFCIAMLLASLLAVVDVTSNSRATTWSLLIIMPVSSILPVVVLQLAASDTLRRARGRMVLWILVFTLTLSLISRTSLGILSTDRYDRFKLDISEWEARCLETNYILQFVVLSWGIAGSVCLSVGIYIISAVVASLRRRKTRNPTHIPRILWWAMIILAFGAMWTLIGWFTYFTFLLRDRARNGNKDAEWSFGQILALSTWVPFVVEFAYLWWEEPEKALNGRLIAPYEVVKVSEETESIELEQTRRDEASARLLHRTTV
ncbi:hypothetical protein BKA63DRAFT_512404 [Paraphoma chrysanthemicola]|nr:hypothetical protein BKA63DRAFT_512404 [Paraphoma chrysanthemicola]